MSIHTEGTPNPNALKFVLNCIVSDLKTYSYKDKNSALNSPLALKLFEFSEVDEVFLGKDFITISKKSDSNWDSIYDKVLDVLNAHIESGEKFIIPTVSSEEHLEMSEIVKRIHEILDQKIRPAVASDGGDIVFESYENGVLKVHLQGACSHCPSSTMTLKAGIESMLKREIPELVEVISV